MIVNASPDLSFIMAAFNAAPWIEAAIASALAQTGISVEVIVVDDASTDDTTVRVEKIAARDSRVRLLRRIKGGGPSAARNLALDVARGTWIAVLDADDEIAPSRGTALLALAQRTGCNVVSDDVERFLDGAPTKPWPVPSLVPEESERRITLAEYLRRNLLTSGGDNLGYLKPIFSRSFLGRHAIRYDERLRIGEDFDLCLRCLAAGTDLALLSRAHYRYRMLSSSLSRQLASADLRAMQVAYDALALEAFPDRSVRRADAAYRRSLGALFAYVSVREGLRERRWSRVLQGIGQIGFWLSVLRFGSRRLNRRRV